MRRLQLFHVIEDFFLADGIHFHAVLFSYLPDCFANAHKNHKALRGFSSSVWLLLGGPSLDVGALGGVGGDHMDPAGP